MKHEIRVDEKGTEQMSIEKRYTCCHFKFKSFSVNLKCSLFDLPLCSEEIACSRRGPSTCISNTPPPQRRHISVLPPNTPVWRRGWGVSTATEIHYMVIHDIISINTVNHSESSSKPKGLDYILDVNASNMRWNFMNEALFTFKVMRFNLKIDSQY